MNFADKQFLIIGASKSGLSAAKLLAGRCAGVTLCDSRKAEAVGTDDILKELERSQVKFHFGSNPNEDMVKEQSCIVISPGVPPEIPPVALAKSLKIPVISEIELAFAFMPAGSRVIGITGTNGKTTTTALTGEIFKKHDNNTRIAGNIGIPYSQEVLELNPGAVVVLELSSFQLEAVERFKPWISCMLNITPDHLNRHHTMEQYVKAKEQIFKNSGDGCYAVLNYDDPAVRQMAQNIKGGICFFSLRETLKDGVYLENGHIFIAANGEKSQLIGRDEIPIPGEHNVENVLAAVAIASCAKIPEKMIRDVIRSFKGVPHRLEYVTKKNDIAFYNDSKGTNPDASIKAIHAIDRPIILIGGGYRKDSDFSQYTKAFHNKVKAFVALGDTKQDIIESARKQGYDHCHEVHTLEEAVTLAYSLAAPGDAVLLSPACASWDMFDNFEQRGDQFKKLVIALKG